MKVGFTGTQIGMTLEQIKEVKRLFKRFKATELHHGDCVGADSEAHTIAKYLEIKTVGHPPIKETKRAWCACDELMEPKSYLVRNRAIVDAVRVVVACPSSMFEVLRSGTWSTVRYAMKKSKPLYVILPTGKIQTFNTGLKHE